MGGCAELTVTALWGVGTIGRCRFLDFRARSVQQTWRSSYAYAGLPKVVASYGDFGPYLAVGSTTGVITVLDVRTGVMVSSARPHDADVNQVRDESERRQAGGGVGGGGTTSSPRPFSWISANPLSPLHHH